MVRIQGIFDQRAIISKGPFIEQKVMSRVAGRCGKGYFLSLAGFYILANIDNWRHITQENHGRIGIYAPQQVGGLHTEGVLTLIVKYHRGRNPGRIVILPIVVQIPSIVDSSRHYT